MKDKDINENYPLKRGEVIAYLINIIELQRSYCFL